MIAGATIAAVLLLLIATPIASAATTAAATNSSCDRSCGSWEVPYPFGFSATCGTQLTCSSKNRVELAGFDVLNLTFDSILINLPAKCNRSVTNMKGLFGDNYAPTARNAFLMRNCGTRSNSAKCLVPEILLRDRFSSVCEGTLTCFAGQEGKDFFNYSDLTGEDCGVVFSSIFANSSTGSEEDVSLKFETVQLEWGVKGTECDCAAEANCTKVAIPGGVSVYQCKCGDGFVGDGFNAGEGCRRKGCDGLCKGTRTHLLIGGVVIVASSVATLALICYCLRRRSTSSKCHTRAKHLIYEAAGSSNIPLFSYREIERATNCFSEKQQLGTGAYGTVYAGILHNDVYVAVKKIKHRDTESTEQVMNEIKLLSSVSHPNLVRLLGCCVEHGEQILVYEYMHNGTLAQHLQRERGNGLPWTIRLTIAFETANAIAYLHSAMNPPIYHRDIKSSNILLDNNYQSKVADFGLSRLGIKETSHISTAPQGTPGYVDPEYHQNYQLSDKSDVYSFGVVLVEIITALKVVDFSRPQSEVNLAALAIDRIGKGRVDEILDPFLEPNRDAWTLSSINKVAELAFRCLAYHRDMRPSMTEVAEELDQIRVSGWAPLEENICVGSSVVSACCSPFNESERSLNSVVTVKQAVASQRVIVPQKLAQCCLGSTAEEVKDSSPVSVRDPWLSEESSPSATSLLGHVVQ
ncbi:Wall-associated receptor kinase-like 14-like protein [Drosera capensis]